MVASSVAVRNAVLASAYLTGSMRRFHLIVFTLKIGCSSQVPTGTDIYRLIYLHPVVSRNQEVFNESFTTGRQIF